MEVTLKEGKKKVGDKVKYFLNVNCCLKITKHVAFIVTEGVIMKKLMPNWLLLLKLPILKMAKR